MLAALHSPTLLPWSRRADDEGRYVRIQTAALGLVMLLAAVVPHLPVFLEPLEPADDPAPVVKLALIPRPPPPPPPRPLGGGETPQPKPVQPQPATSAAPAQQPTPRQAPSAQAARERAARTGVLSAAHELAALQNSAVLTSIQSERPLIGAVSAKPSDNPELLVAGAEQGSGGISISGVGQANAGGTTLREGGTGGSIGRGGPQGSGGTGGGSGGGTGGQGTYQPKRSSESIQLVFDRNKAAFESLYQRALRQNPGLQGAVVFELTIQPSGKVSACRVVSSELRDPELEAKLVSRILLLDFGPEDVPAITVVNPLRFYPR
ncbi:MAG TPA: AgmX/PglI C-terminal domain-containing protein [Nevskiales bacterium]|nr:AgmX/PglI C-terminal domain-containing protein [Nevskiales bacterium]